MSDRSAESIVRGHGQAHVGSRIEALTDPLVGAARHGHGIKCGAKRRSRRRQDAPANLAGACDYSDEAIGVVTEIGAIEDIIELRTQQAVLLQLTGDQGAAEAAIAAAERTAAGVTWPYALIDLALAKAELARLGGDAEEARDQLGRATGLLGDTTERPHVRAYIHDLIGHIADDLDEARAHRAAAYRAAVESGVAVVIAQALVGVADPAARLDRYDQAARLPAASADVRGGLDRSHPDAVRIEAEAQRRRAVGR